MIFEKIDLEKEKSIIQKEKEIVTSFEETVIKYITTKNELELNNIEKYTRYFNELIRIIDGQKKRIRRFVEIFEKQKLLLFKLTYIIKEISKKNSAELFDQIKDYCEQFKKECDLLKNLIEEMTKENKKRRNL